MSIKKFNELQSDKCERRLCVLMSDLLDKYPDLKTTNSIMDYLDDKESSLIKCDTLIDNLQYRDRISELDNFTSIDIIKSDLEDVEFIINVNWWV